MVDVDLVTFRKCRQDYYRHLKKIGVPYKVRIELARLFRKDMLELDKICEILDKLNVSHDLINVGFDDLERYRCKYYNGAWLHEDTQLVCDNGKFVLTYGMDFVC